MESGFVFVILVWQKQKYTHIHFALKKNPLSLDTTSFVSTPNFIGLFSLKKKIDNI